MAFDTAYKQDETTGNSNDSQHANGKDVTKAENETSRMETGYSFELDSDGVPRMTLARLSLILGTLWVDITSVEQDMHGRC